MRLLLAKAAATPTLGRGGRPDPDLPLVSARTLQQIHAMLRATLNQAVREELIARNVARLVQPPTPQRDEIQPWTDAEARRAAAHIDAGLAAPAGLDAEASGDN